jgi:hypothetical protein
MQRVRTGHNLRFGEVCDQLMKLFVGYLFLVFVLSGEFRESDVRVGRRQLLAIDVIAAVGFAVRGSTLEEKALGTF